MENENKLTAEEAIQELKRIQGRLGKQSTAQPALTMAIESLSQFKPIANTLTADEFLLDRYSYIKTKNLKFEILDFTFSDLCILLDDYNSQFKPVTVSDDEIPNNNTLELMKRVNDAESKANGHFNHLMEYMNMVEDIVGFAGPVESVNRELLKLKSEWINIKDKLPTERMLPVLLFNGDAPEYTQHVFKGTWYSQSQSFVRDIDNYKLHGSVTHWKPLPQPPNGCVTS